MSSRSRSYDGAVTEPNPRTLAYDGLDTGAREALAADGYPDAIVNGLRGLGMFGFTAQVARGLARRWEDERDGT
jgi:hypothetical protein